MQTNKLGREGGQKEYDRATKAEYVENLQALFVRLTEGRQEEKERNGHTMIGVYLEDQY